MGNSPIIDPQAWLRLPDRDLGLLLLAQAAETAASNLGLPIEKVSIEFMERVRQHVLTLKAESAKLAPVEVALHAVASGDPERAGRLYRELLRDGATALVYERFTAKELRRRAMSRKKGGKAAAASRRAKSKAPRIREKAAELERKKRPRHEWAGIIAEQFGVSARYVREVLREKRK